MNSKNLVSLILFITLTLLLACKPETETQQPNYLEESKEAFNERMEWWRNDHFGMFIHWGLYAVPAGIYKGEEVEGIGEWIMNTAQISIDEYELYAKEFNPTKFDADQWVRIIKDAGMKYVVITSKHHDGFGLWDSQVSDYNVVDFSPYQKDILKELSEACKKEGIKFGLYHSIMDWHHQDAQAINYPNYNGYDSSKANPNFPNYIENYLKPQLKELITNYDPAILWFDGEWIPEYTHEQGLDIYQYCRSLKPSILVNNRVDKGRQGYQGMNKTDADYAGDFGTPEQEILDTKSNLDWESCMTMNDTWGFKKNDHNWKSAKELVDNLIDVVAKGGNYLLNIGPKADGTIPIESIDRLEQVGKWMNVNSEAIYNTESLTNNYKQGDNIRFTKKKGESTFYAITLSSPGNEISFKYLKPSADSKIYLLGSDMPLEWKYDDAIGVTITVPGQVLKNLGETFAWSFKIEGEEI